MADTPAQQHGALLTHIPLPYVVRVRVAVDDDAPPECREYRVVAYSVVEAMIQVSLQLTSAMDLSASMQIRVEHIAPDTGAYAALYGDALVAASLLRGPRPPQ
jgi:hypothetical protein